MVGCIVITLKENKVSSSESNTPKDLVNHNISYKKDVRSNSPTLATKGIESKPCFANKRSFHTYSFRGNNLDTSNGTHEGVTLKGKKW